MPKIRIELIEVEPNYFTVIVGDRFADQLCRDEALGVIAGALFCKTKEPPFLKTYAQWSAWDQRYRHNGQQFQPAALLAWNGAKH